MSTIGLTPEQRQLIDQAGDRPVRIEDPEMQQAYVLIRADVYDRFRDVIEPRSGKPFHVPEGMLRSQAAFFRDLPGLLRDPGLRGQSVAYWGDERVKVARTETEVIRECLRRGLSDDEYDVFIIEPQSPEPEEVDDPSSWYES